MDIKQIWNASLSYIQNDINSVVGYNTYIKDIVPISFEGENFAVAVSTSICKTMIELRYTEIIEKSISKIVARPVKLTIILKDQFVEPEKGEATPVYETNEKKVKTNLNPKYTFDNFVIGPSNEYATAIAMSTAKYPGQEKNNPLFLYGNSGLGKTHLMQAIGNEILKNSPEKKVVYVTSERFTNEMIESLHVKDMGSFRQLYRNVDVLLIDDIQFIENKQGTQEEFFHTFNDLYLNNKQIVLTSDRKPKDLVTIEERLKTRFEWGLNIDITSPDYETRVAILKKKAEAQKSYISEEVLSYIAERIDSNVRELEGALLQIISYAGIKNLPITIDTAEAAIRSIVPDDGVIKITPQKIIDSVSSYYNISADEILGKSKQKNIALPRQIVMYLCKTLTNMNFVMIAKALGNKDRTTIMYGVDKIMELIKTDSILKSDIDAITKDINSL
ncbi:MAG: chromosomal replication initiator protein DnaA [Ruminococcaceae bacterium]|nr:chromosomal replication initiator protein DnaA [Oscillospiraceae bacterium]